MPPARKPGGEHQREQRGEHDEDGLDFGASRDLAAFDRLVQLALCR
jgi:hypothetical protein